jgi:hypothetical protein
MVRPRRDEVIDMKASLLALALALASGPALAEQFVLLVHEAPEQLALRADSGAAGEVYWAKYADWGKEAAAAGIMRGGAPMVPVPAGLVGAAVEPGALVLGGFFVIEVADAATAAEWAAKLPAAETGAVEIRSAIEAPGM